MATLRQKKAIKALVGLGGNVTKAMLAAGYSPNTANTPQKLTKSEGWKELMDKGLSDSRLLKKHQQLLNAESENVQLGALDLGYKIKKRYEESPLSARPLTINIMNFNEAKTYARKAEIVSGTLSPETSRIESEV